MRQYTICYYASKLENQGYKDAVSYEEIDAEDDDQAYKAANKLRKEKKYIDCEIWRHLCGRDFTISAADIRNSNRDLKVNWTLK